MESSRQTATGEQPGPRLFDIYQTQSRSLHSRARFDELNEQLWEEELVHDGESQSRNQRKITTKAQKKFPPLCLCFGAAEVEPIGPSDESSASLNANKEHSESSVAMRCSHGTPDGCDILRGDEEEIPSGCQWGGMRLCSATEEETGGLSPLRRRNSCQPHVWFSIPFPEVDVTGKEQKLNSGDGKAQIEAEIHPGPCASDTGYGTTTEEHCISVASWVQDAQTAQSPRSADRQLQWMSHHNPPQQEPNPPSLTTCNDDAHDSDCRPRRYLGGKASVALSEMMREVIGEGWSGAGSVEPATREAGDGVGRTASHPQPDSGQSYCRGPGVVSPSGTHSLEILPVDPSRGRIGSSEDQQRGVMKHADTTGGNEPELGPDKGTDSCVRGELEEELELLKDESEGGGGSSSEEEAFMPSDTSSTMHLVESWIRGSILGSVDGSGDHQESCASDESLSKMADKLDPPNQVGSMQPKRITQTEGTAANVMRSERLSDRSVGGGGSVGGPYVHWSSASPTLSISRPDHATSPPSNHNHVAKEGLIPVDDEPEGQQPARPGRRTELMLGEVRDLRTTVEGVQRQMDAMQQRRLESMAKMQAAIRSLQVGNTDSWSVD